MESRSGRPLLLLFAFLTLGVFALHTYVFRHHVTDDAFISLRYLENLVRGEGLVFNPGERVWGYTNFLWIAVLAPPVALGADPLAAARLLGIALGATIVAVVWLGPARNGTRVLNPAGALLLASCGAFVLQGPSGLETGLFTLLVLLAILALASGLERGRGSLRALSGLLFALATMTRPEGIFYLGAALLVVATLPPAGDRARTLLEPLLVFAPLVLVFVLVMHGYYDALWPNSLDAKVGFSFEQVKRGVRYLQRFVAAYPVHVLLLFVGAIHFPRLAIFERLCTALGALGLGLYTLAGGDWMPGYRLFHPTLLLSTALAPATLGFAAQWLRRPTAQTLVVLSLAAAVLGLASSYWDERVHDATRRTWVHRGIRVGKWMKQNLPPGSLLATNTAGSIAYYSELPIIDMMGLTDTTIARRDDLPAEWRGIEKGDGAYVLSRKPEFIQFASTDGAAEPRFLSDIEIFTTESFWREYELVEFDLPPPLLLYQRRRQPTEGPTAERWREIRSIAARKFRNSGYRY